MASRPRVIEIGDIFKAEPCTTFKLLNEPGRCFFVPPYQRDFDWSIDNVERLLGDICRGWKQTDDKVLAATFLGSIITVLASSRDDFPEEVQSHLPASIGAIVDGQQRLTTMLMLCVALHNALSQLSAKIEKKTGEGDVWLHDRAALLLDDLQPMFEQKMGGGDEPFIFYPRLIRRPGDTWGRRQGIAKYVSPIALLLNSYSAHIRSGDKDKAFKPKAATAGSDDFDVQQTLLKTYTFVTKSVTKIAKGQSGAFDIPSLRTILSSELMQHSLIDVAFPTSVKDRIQEAIGVESGGKQDAFGKLVRLVVFSRYFCRRVMVTLINAMNEEYAFDIFESLNTTGEPLTALQTLRPRVVASVTARKWEASDEKEHLDVVDAYIRTFGTPSQRQRKTAELLTGFALAENGAKLSLRLAEQRLWMQKRFDDLESQSGEQREFVRGIATIAAFMHRIWPERPDKASEIALAANETELARLCLGTLRQANHTVSIALLSRFWGAWWQAPAEKRDAPAKELLEVLQAVTAFWVLWRLSRRDTGGIDDIYRDLMAKGFARMPPGGTARPLLAEGVRSELAKQLADAGVGTKVEWIDTLQRIPGYGNETAATRLALLAAMHDSEPDEHTPGLWKEGRNATFDALKFSVWADAKNATIEHVAPQTKSVAADWDWDDALYEDEDTVDLLGNLVLFPADTNSSINNASWKYKAAVYRVVASKTQEQFDAAKSALAADGVVLSASTEQFLKDHPHLRQMEAFHGFRGPWNLDFVKQRTKNLAGLAWNRLAPWLGLTDDGGAAAGGAAPIAVAVTTLGSDDDELVADDSEDLVDSNSEGTSGPVSA